MWHVKWTVRYVFVWIAMLILADWQLLYRFNFPAFVPWTIMTISTMWLFLGLFELIQIYRGDD